MRIPDLRGQYRYVRYTNDGCNIYQCLWCLSTIESHDDPNYGWNFCPKCGKSWFSRLECRAHEVPRWYYDRWGNGDNPDSPALSEFYKRPASQATWVIEWRSKWFHDEWTMWNHEYSIHKNPCYPDWQMIRRTLVDFRSRHDSDDCIKFEYRARLVRGVAATTKGESHD
ncbi:MAG: hypothetical protein MN733_39875 [Nitrososphaera sp.]|nr:hypothetical protein [Nitrososphaera sp.]